MKSVCKLVFGLALLVSMSAEAVIDAEYNAALQALEKQDYPVAKKFLDKHSSSRAKDPDYYVILLNYVGNKGRHEINVLSKGEGQEGDFVLTDPKTGEKVGFMGSRVEYDKDFIVDGIRKTQKALPGFNSRLDIHLGLTGIARRIESWDIVGQQCVEVLKVSRVINNKWTWGSVNSMSGDPEQFMIRNILTNTYSLFRAESDQSDKALDQVSQALIKYYPELIYGYANLGALHLAKGDYAKSERYLNQALKIDPKDRNVLANLAELKKRKAAQNQKGAATKPK